MSLSIDVAKVDEVLLADGEWHRVTDHSFNLDAYEFEADGHNVLAGAEVAGVPSTGATWREGDGSVFHCPVTAILAVKTHRQREPGPTRAPKRSKTVFD